MKLIALLILSGIGVSPLIASGTWTGSFQVSGSDGGVPQYFVLSETGSKLSGTGGPDASEHYPIANGQVNGNHITFDLTNSYAKFFYDLIDSGTAMKGKLTIRSLNSTRTAVVTLRKTK
jgi:hypothetical protein